MLLTGVHQQPRNGQCMFALTNQQAFFRVVLPTLQVRLANANSAAVREWSGTAAVATELGASTFFRSSSGDLRLVSSSDGGNGDDSETGQKFFRLDASLR